MSAKVTMVRLRAKDSGRTKAFEIDHARNILRIVNTAWELVDENFIFVGNEIRRNKNKDGGRKTE